MANFVVLLKIGSQFYENGNGCLKATY